MLEDWKLMGGFPLACVWSVYGNFTRPGFHARLGDH
jgi:hypothetical protein